jgi:DNA-binding HxlR family transcriptional regulator
MLALRFREMQRFGLIRKNQGGNGKVVAGYETIEKGSALIAFLAMAGKFSTQHSSE